MARRNRWLSQPLSWKRGGALALGAAVVLAVAALVMDSRSTPELEDVERYIRDRGRPPVELIEEAGRSARMILLADIHGHAGPKRLASRAIRALAEGPGLDAVVLEVPSDEQPYIDAYLSRIEEDAAALLARPMAVREQDGTARDYLEIYRAVWAMNREVGAARRIRVIAADLPQWPPAEGASPQTVTERYAARAEHMVQRMDAELLNLMPEARVLVFVDGYLTLQRVSGQLRSAGGETTRIEWLGELLRQRAPADVRTLLVDAGASATAVRRLPEYHGTAFHRPLRRSVPRSAAVRVDDTFSVIRTPISETSSPGLRLEIVPRNYVLRDVADGYIHLRGGG